MKARSVGTSIKIGDSKVGSLNSISGLKLSSETTDVTTLDSTGGYSEFLGGFKSGGDVQVAGYLDSEAEGQKAMYTAFESQEVQVFTIEFPNGVTWSFGGIVTAFETGAEVKDAVTFAGTIKVSGKPELAWAAAAAAVNEEAADDSEEQEEA